MSQLKILKRVLLGTVFFGVVGGNTALVDDPYVHDELERIVQRAQDKELVTPDAVVNDGVLQITRPTPGALARNDGPSNDPLPFSGSSSQPTSQPQDGLPSPDLDFVGIKMKIHESCLGRRGNYDCWKVSDAFKEYTGLETNYIHYGWGCKKDRLGNWCSDPNRFEYQQELWNSTYERQGEAAAWVLVCLAQEMVADRLQALGSSIYGKWDGNVSQHHMSEDLVNIIYACGNMTQSLMSQATFVGDQEVVEQCCSTYFGLAFMLGMFHELVRNSVFDVNTQVPEITVYPQLTDKFKEGEQFVDKIKKDNRLDENCLNSETLTALGKKQTVSSELMSQLIQYIFHGNDFDARRLERYHGVSPHMASIALSRMFAEKAGVPEDVTIGEFALPIPQERESYRYYSPVYSATLNAPGEGNVVGKVDIHFEEGSIDGTAEVTYNNEKHTYQFSDLGFGLPFNVCTCHQGCEIRNNPVATLVAYFILQQFGLTDTSEFTTVPMLPNLPLRVKEITGTTRTPIQENSPWGIVEKLKGEGRVDRKTSIWIKLLLESMSLSNINAYLDNGQLKIENSSIKTCNFDENKDLKALPKPAEARNEDQNEEEARVEYPLVPYTGVPFETGPLDLRTLEGQLDIVQLLYSNPQFSAWLVDTISKKIEKVYANLGVNEKPIAQVKAKTEAYLQYVAQNLGG